MIQSLLKDGKRFSAGDLTIYWNDNPEGRAEIHPAAFLVSSDAGNAAERNRLKRWLREDYRKLQTMNPVSGNFAIRFRGRVDRVTHNQLSYSLQSAFREVVAGKE